MLSDPDVALPYKFGEFRDDEWVPFRYSDIYELQKTTGPQRLAIAPAGNQIELLLNLAQTLPEPFGILYVLLVSREGNDLGRYQSPAPIGGKKLENFLVQFQDYLELDGRHHLWITSLPSSSTLVYDQHNVVYAYGPLDQFEERLIRRGMSAGEIRFPAPHQHMYHPAFDVSENQMLAYWDWKQFPLAPGDEA